MHPNKDFIQRKRVGEIKHIEPNGNFGFIEAEDFRDDVFFHLSVWESEKLRPEVLMVVEYELNQEHFREKNQLRATVVRPTDRPYTQRLSPSADARLQVKHHEKARRQKPNWRKK